MAILLWKNFPHPVPINFHSFTLGLSPVPSVQNSEMLSGKPNAKCRSALENDGKQIRSK